MKWPSRSGEKRRLIAALRAHSSKVRPLEGLVDAASLETLAMQFIASLRREEYYSKVQQKKISAERADPNSPQFDAERAVAYHMQNGNLEEAAWLVFLMTHLARPANTGWLRLRIYMASWATDVGLGRRYQPTLMHSRIGSMPILT